MIPAYFVKIVQSDPAPFATLEEFMPGQFQKYVTNYLETLPRLGKSAASDKMQALMHYTYLYFGEGRALLTDLQGIVNLKFPFSIL